MHARHTIQIDLLGGLRVRQGDQVITRFSTQKTAALLAYLAFQASRASSRGKPQPREQLIEMLWPSSALQAGRASLSMALSSLRHQLEPPGVPSATVLIADRFAVHLNPEVVETDVARFEKAMESARRTASPIERAAYLREVVESYSGSLLPGFYEDWIAAEQQRLASLCYQAVHQLIRYEVRAGDATRALDHARRLVQLDPLREEAHHDLMRLLAASGQPAAALQQFREMEEILRREIGAAPSTASRQLAREIEQLGAAPLPDLPEEHRPAAPVAAPEVPSGLPAGTVTFLAAEPGGLDVLAEETARNGGHVVRASTEAAIMVFGRATDALACALGVRHALDSAAETGDTAFSTMRIALHTGEVAAEPDGSYGGAARDRTLALLQAANPGQALASEVCASLLRYRVEPGAWNLVEVGAYRLRGADEAERLYQVTYAGMPERTFPPPRAEAAFSAQIPSPVTRFFGRARELARLTEMLAPSGSEAAHRLITILGPGGTGKTRLAIEAARRAAGHFGGAVWFVPLAELPDDADSRQVAEKIAGTLGASRESPDPFEQIAAVIRGRKALLALDNLEQIVDSAAAAAQRLLAENPLLSLVVTSRHKLELSHEIELALAPLPVPNAQASPELLAQIESVQLFVDRAQSVKPDFQLTAANAEAVARLCERLEGIPLALELAAARAQVLTPGQMLAQLAKQASRFDLLVSRKRDLAERHRTLRGAIEWSYRLLAPNLQSFMARLSVFRGGWSLEAAEEVLDEPLALDYLAQLRECSLIVTHEVKTAASPEPEIRFRMLETLREYAADALSRSPEAESALQAHLRFFLALAERAEPYLRGPEQVAWMDRLAVEHENLRAGLRFALTLGEEDDSALRMVAALWRFWAVRGYFAEGRAWCEEVLQRAGGGQNSGRRVRARNGAGLLVMQLADYPAARGCFEAALAESREIGDRAGEADSLRNLGILHSDLKRLDEARALHEGALEIWRSLGDRQGMASALANLGLVAIHQEQFDRARELLTDSLAITRSLGNEASAANTLNTLGMLAYRRLDYIAAAEAFRESLEIDRKVGNPRGIATALLNLGSIETELGETAAAHAHLCEAVDMVQQVGDRRILAHAVNGLAALAARMGRAETAAMTFGAVEALCESVRLEPLSARDSEDAEVAALRESLGPSAFASLWTRGRTLDLQNAIDAVRRETAL